MYWIDQITFGTPTVDQYSEMNRQTYLDSLFADFAKYGYPENSSDATKEIDEREGFDGHDDESLLGN